MVMANHTGYSNSVSMQLCLLTFKDVTVRQTSECHYDKFSNFRQLIHKNADFIIIVIIFTVSINSHFRTDICLTGTTVYISSLER
jgi:hypothetical protein